MRLALLFTGLVLFTRYLAQQAEPPKLLFKEDWNELPPFEVMNYY
jgi:hypothetical protein